MVYPLKRFLQYFLWGREPQDRNLTPNITAIVTLQRQKSPKKVILGKNCPSEKNSGGRLENLNIGAQLQTFLCAMTP